MTTWIEDYNQHMSRLREGIKLLNLLDGECTCKQNSCDTCKPAIIANSDDGILSTIIDQEENVYFEIINALGEYPSNAYDVIRSKITPSQECTLNLNIIIGTWYYWSPNRKEQYDH